MTHWPREVATISDLTDRRVLGRHFGPCSQVIVDTFETAGFSGARFFRVILHQTEGGQMELVLKLIDLSKDWFALRSADKGREGLSLLAPDLRRVHRSTHPYRLIALEYPMVGILMDDLSHGLFPDERVPLSRSDQDDLLDHLAHLHATYWQDEQVRGMP